jgi:transcriptional regulator with XRE-family HTH domain
MSRSPYLAAVLQEQGMSQGELTRRTGLSKQTIWDAFHGRHVSSYTMAKIAIALGVPLSQLDPAAAADLDGLIVR